MKKIIFLITILSLFMVSSVLAETKVNRIAIAKTIENKEPVEVSKAFKNNINKLYCFTEIITDKYPTKVVHIWLYNDNIVAEIPLQVNSKKWRTYSSKIITPTSLGNWKVEVYSEDGKLIDSTSFIINE